MSMFRAPRTAIHLLILPVTLTCALLALCAASTHQKSAADEPAAGEKAAESVKDILDRTIKAYQDAKSYRDSGKMVFVVRDADGEKREEFPLRLDFERPNRLRIEFTPVRPAILEGPGRTPKPVLLLLDGKQLHARPTGFDGQVFTVPAPEQISANALYNEPAFVPVLPDGLPDGPVLGMIGVNPVLELLASDEALQEVDWDSGKVLAPHPIQGRQCNRIEFPEETGVLVLWIDKETSVVRRVQYPMEGLKNELQAKGVTALELTAELDGAVLNPKADEKRFAWVANAEDRPVDKLTFPPNPAEAPSKVLGKPVADFEFKEAAADKRKSKTLEGKITVIDLWVTDCTTCPEQLPHFDAVRKQYANNDKVQFLALSLDPNEISTEDVDGLLKDAQAQPPSFRLTSDVAAFRKALGPTEMPAVLLLDSQGRVQAIDFEEDPAKVEENLPVKIEALLAGEDLAGALHKAWQERRQQYEQEVKEAVENYKPDPAK
ncbi:MAG: TlpA family protein disulfide reductase [Planctomycetes bacterium]|nr:TlpA family protein disulfide reductase [Planctomycetota bacterium]